MMCHRFVLLTSAIVLSVATQAQATLIDTYTRSDATDLGTTELGGFSYTEGDPSHTTSPVGNPGIDIAHITSGQLVVSGTAEDSVAGGRAQLNLPGNGFSDIQVGVDVSFDFDGVTSGTALNNTAFVEFRQPSNGTFSANAASTKGVVRVEMFSNGNLVVRERLPSSILNTGYDSSGTGISLSGINNFALGAASTHYDFDLAGDTLKISVNGSPIISHTLDATLPTNTQNLIGLGKNKWTGSGTATPYNVVFDNLDISPVPEPSAIVLATMVFSIVPWRGRKNRK